MESWLRRAGAPAHPHDLGVPIAKLAADCRRARLIRRRYTILDCLDDLGWLDRAIGALVTGNGFWAQRAHIAASETTGQFQHIAAQP